MNRFTNLIMELIRNEEQLETIKLHAEEQSKHQGADRIKVLEQKIKAMESKVKNADTIKKQADNQHEEYMRLADKYNELEVGGKGKVLACSCVHTGDAYRKRWKIEAMRKAKRHPNCNPACSSHFDCIKTAPRLHIGFPFIHHTLKYYTTNWREFVPKSFDSNGTCTIALSSYPDTVRLPSLSDTTTTFSAYSSLGPQRMRFHHRSHTFPSHHECRKFSLFSTTTCPKMNTWIRCIEITMGPAITQQHRPS